MDAVQEYSRQLPGEIGLLASEFAAFTKAGQILDPRRILVTSHSNFGAPLAQADAAEGAVLSLDPEGPTIAIATDNSCGHINSGLDDDGSIVRAVTAYLSALPAPLSERSTAKSHQQGRQLFSSACASCHTPALLSRRGEVALHSDLLLHDIGPALNDGIVQDDATSAEWRTTPLWGLRLRTRFLHDGRAATLAEAILTHDGEGAAAARAFRQLTQDDRKTLLDFLSGL